MNSEKYNATKFICDLVVKRNEIAKFLKQIIKGNENRLCATIIFVETYGRNTIKISRCCVSGGINQTEVILLK